MIALDPPRADETEAPEPSTRSGLQPRLSEPPPNSSEFEAGHMDAFGITDRGRVRTSNQDQFLITEFVRAATVTHGSITSRVGRTDRASQARLLAVADGMGGYEGGGLASSVAIESLSAFVLEALPWFPAAGAEQRDLVVEVLKTGVRIADEAVHRTAIELELDERMGTTLTAAYVAWPEAFVVHVGDSRAYLLRDGALRRLTVDHTVAQELLAVHALDAGQAARSQLRHVLVNTVGGLRDKRLSVEVTVLALQPGDTLMLATDGVAAHVSDEELPELVTTARCAEDASRNIVDIVLARGGADNVTAVVARF